MKEIIAISLIDGQVYDGKRYSKGAEIKLKSAGDLQLLKHLGRVKEKVKPKPKKQAASKSPAKKPEGDQKEKA